MDIYVARSAGWGSLLLRTHNLRCGLNHATSFAGCKLTQPKSRVACAHEEWIGAPLRLGIAFQAIDGAAGFNLTFQLASKSRRVFPICINCSSPEGLQMNRSTPNRLR